MSSSDDDAMISKAYHEKVVSELNSRIQRLEKEVAELRQKLVVKVEEERQKVLCPTCGKRLKYDGEAEEWACPRDGWRGPRTEAIVED